MQTTDAPTSQPVNRPLFELLERDLRCRRDAVEVEPVVILLLFISGICKLLLLVIYSVSSFRVNTIGVRSNHRVDRQRCCEPWLIGVNDSGVVVLFAVEGDTRRECLSGQAALAALQPYH